MRETRNAQSSIFDFYCEHELGSRFKSLSDLLDKQPDILDLIENDFDKKDVARTGASGLSLESILRCLLLKQILNVSYRKLSFHLCDSPTYRSFARLRNGQSPCHSSLQGTVRRVSPETLEKINTLLIGDWIESDGLDVDTLRIDSTVVKSNILDPTDSQLLDDGVRLLSRLMSRSKASTGVKVRFCDQRKRSKSLAFRIFHAKKAEKEALYPTLLACVRTVLRQIDKAIDKVRLEANVEENAEAWIKKVEHYRVLLLRVVDQTERRVLNNEAVPSSEKLVSFFEPHTDIIVKGKRDVEYGHKINLATQQNGFVTYLNIEDGNPADKNIYLPVLEAQQKNYQQLPHTVVADGGYASQENVEKARGTGVERAVFNKRVNLGYHQMGVKKKTFNSLKNFRAGIEGNISELKRAFGMDKARWKGHDGFKAYVWSSVLSYNLIGMIRFSSA